MVLIALAAFTLGEIRDAPADILFNTTFSIFDPFTTDTDPNSDGVFVKWSWANAGIDPLMGNPNYAGIGRTTYSSIGDARTNDQVFRFALAPHAGYALNLTSISFDLAASRASTATADYVAQAFMFSDRDMQATPIAAGFSIDMTGDGMTSPFMTWTGNLSSNPLFQNVTVPIVFSLHITGSNADSYAFLDNIRIDGVTSAVPEPSTWLLLGVGALLLLARVSSRVGGRI